MELTPTELRKNLYKILDRVAEKGEEVLVRRKGKVLRIKSDKPPGRFDKLEPHDVIIGNPEELVSLKTAEWDEGKILNDIP